MSIRQHRSGMMRTLFQLERENLRRRYMVGGWYPDAVQMEDYKVEIQEDEHDTHFLIWNPDRPCIIMVIDKENKEAVIDSVEYSPGCSVDGRMKRGEGTRKMIDFAIRLLKSRGARSVELADNSRVVCNGKKIRLGLMYFFKFGQTWYEKYFGFQPKEPYTQRYQHAKELQRTLTELHDKPCDYFTDDVLDELLAKHKLVFLQSMSWVRVL